MGSYLLIIAGVDARYRGVYFIHDSTWRSSELCHLAGFISTFSSELSVFTLTGKYHLSSIIFTVAPHSLVMRKKVGSQSDGFLNETGMHMK